MLFSVQRYIKTFKVVGYRAKLGATRLQEGAELLRSPRDSFSRIISNGRRGRTALGRTLAAALRTPLHVDQPLEFRLPSQQSPGGP